MWQVGGGVWCGSVLHWGLGLLGRLALVRSWVVSRGECTTGLTWDPREGSHRANTGQARGCPMRRPAYEPSPQVKPVVLSPFDIKEDCVSTWLETPGECRAPVTRAAPKGPSLSSAVSDGT